MSNSLGNYLAMWESQRRYERQQYMVRVDFRYKSSDSQLLPLKQLPQQSAQAQSVCSLAKLHEWLGMDTVATTLENHYKYNLAADVHSIIVTHYTAMGPQTYPGSERGSDMILTDEAFERSFEQGYDPAADSPHITIIMKRPKRIPRGG